MGGSLLELLAVGKQDIPLIGNPQISYFKSVFKRHSNFSIDTHALSFNENVEFNKKVTCLIEKKGDLLSKIYLEIKLPALSSGISWVNGIGHVIIEKVEFEIGGHIVDTIYGQFLDIYSELDMSEDHRNGYFQMIGKHNSFTKYSQDTNNLTLYIPLNFWFSKDFGRSLPLIALQYHDVKVNVHIRPFRQLWYSGTSMSSVPSSSTSITNACLYAEYIYLDTPERKQFAIKNHSYLIEQHQKCSNNPVLNQTTSSRANLDFNLPVKELYWVYQANSVADTNDWLNYSATLDDDQDPQPAIEPISKTQFLINGMDRVESRDSAFFRLVQPFYYHTRVSDKFIYSYSFSLNPEKSHPSGHLNFSWINNAELIFTHPRSVIPGVISVYAVNYNYLQISKGMANLVYQS